MSAHESPLTAIKRLRQEKQQIAAQFKFAEPHGEAWRALRERMASVSAELKRANQACRNNANALTDDREAARPPAPRLPAHFAVVPVAGGAPAGMRVEPLGDENSPEWDRFVREHPRATSYHDSRWRQVICGTMRGRSWSLLARAENGEVLGVLPLYQLESRLFGNFAVSVPYVNYGGALGRSMGIEAALMREAASRGAAEGLDHIEFRDPFPRAGWPSREHKVSMLLPLPRDADALDRAVGAKLRAQIRRARREATTVRRGRGPAELDAFYDVFARNMRDLGTPVYAKALFAQILELWPEDAVILIVEFEGRPAAGAFLIRHRGTLEIPWASSLRKYNRIAVNMLMYWEALVLAIEQGCQYFDFGRSSVGSGTYQFKRQWGALPAQHYWHYWLPEGTELPQLNADNPRYRLLVETWRRLPLAVTRWLGPAIVRRLP